MGAYLVDNPPRRSQYRKPRRAKPTGTVVLHSAENAPDLRLPDEGAERIARFIRDRSDAGSYHKIADQDSRIQLVPFEWEAFGDGTGSNRWAIHLSLALRASDWPKLTKQQQLWYMAGLAICAREASDWLRAHYSITVPVRRLTKASASQPGFCSHMDRETWFGKPGRRTDPWRNDDEMWHLFLTLYADTAPAPAPEDDLMDPRAFVVLAYYSILQRPPESLERIDKGAQFIKGHPQGEREGQNAYVAHVAASPEAQKLYAKKG